MIRSILGLAVAMLVGCGSSDEGRGQAPLLGSDAGDASQADADAGALPLVDAAAPPVVYDASAVDGGASDAPAGRVACAVAVDCPAPESEACGDCATHQDCVCVLPPVRAVCVTSVDCSAPQKEACGDCATRQDCVCVASDAG